MPSFSYIKGTTNKVADALSRNIAPVCPVASDLLAAQSSDPMWSKVIHYLDSGGTSDPPKVSSLSHYLLQDKLLYKATTFTGKHEPSRLIHQLVFPQALVPSVLKLIHDTPHASHPCKDKTLSQARLKYLWMSMRKVIYAYIDACHICALNKGNLHAHVPMLSYPVPSAP